MDKAMLDFYSNVILSSFSLFDSNKRVSYIESQVPDKPSLVRIVLVQRKMDFVG